MPRLYRPAYAASFALAGLMAWAGLARATVSPQARPAAPALQLASIPLAPKESHLPASVASANKLSKVVWSARVEASLASLVPVSMRPHRARALGQRLTPVLASASTRSTVAMHVRDLSDGRVLFDQRGGWHLNPASNQKILTAHAAVELLGADYHFETTLLRSGDTLILRGQGDPSLTLSDLDSLARAAHAKGELVGLRTIRVDDTSFSQERFAPGSDEHEGEAAYLAPTGAASLNFNTVEIIARPGPVAGSPVEVEIFPPSCTVEFINRARTGRGALRVTSHRAPDGHTVVELGGKMRPGARPVSTRRRIHDPAAFVGGALSQLIAELGDGEQLEFELGKTPISAKTVATHRSRDLVDVLAASMKYSNNFTTEQVLRTLAWRSSGQPGSFSQGVDLLQRFAKQISSVEDEARFVNGSGLSHAGRVSPRLLVDLMTLSQREGSASASLLSSYARAGGEGTMQYRNASAGARVRAKTGTLAGVSALSGVVYSRDGARQLAFSLLVNGADAKDSRAMQDRAVLELLDWLDRQS